ncbi:hypothetical protein [Wolbachia endosymbiont of Folsomia candida]|uniref:hypothetical protein n=1 Tax=Wolbachia endosymbiont of Folsomia candida TaxID=169402 RepID=UPI00130098A9|nr:hypothetical protein [Wolbachia endosymbiont of Folsomia candida]
MTYQLKLQNVIQYIPDAGQGNTGYKFYGITAQNQDTGAESNLHLNNARYVRHAVNYGGDEVEASRTFDCKFYNINKDTDRSKEIFHIEGLKLDGVVQYDSESHTFTAPVDENQQVAMPACYVNQFNAIMNDDLSLLG